MPGQRRDSAPSGGIVGIVTWLLVIPAAAVLGTYLPGLFQQLFSAWSATSAAVANEFSDNFDNKHLQQFDMPAVSVPAFTHSEKDTSAAAVPSAVTATAGSANVAGCVGTSCAIKAPEIPWEQPPQQSAAHAPGNALQAHLAGQPAASSQSPTSGKAELCGLSPSQVPQPPASGESSLPTNQLFVAMQARLQQLGAVYYLLETWGDNPAYYRFFARIAVDGNPNVTRHFEAVDRDPIRAMQRVLQQVETWHRSNLHFAP